MSGDRLDHLTGLNLPGFASDRFPRSLSLVHFIFLVLLIPFSASCNRSAAQEFAKTENGPAYFALAFLALGLVALAVALSSAGTTVGNAVSKISAVQMRSN
jgi:Ca2+/Na+ antiporter